VNKGISLVEYLCRLGSSGRILEAKVRVSDAIHFHNRSHVLCESFLSEIYMDFLKKGVWCSDALLVVSSYD